MIVTTDLFKCMRLTCLSKANPHVQIHALNTHACQQVLQRFDEAPMSNAVLLLRVRDARRNCTTVRSRALVSFCRWQLLAGNDWQAIPSNTHNLQTQLS